MSNGDVLYWLPLILLNVWTVALMSGEMSYNLLISLLQPILDVLLHISDFHYHSF